MNIFSQLKHSLGSKNFIGNEEFFMITSKIELLFLNSSLNNRFVNFMNTIGTHTDKSRLVYLIDIFQESCLLLKDIVTRKESFELIAGFEYDIDLFSHIKGRSHETYKLSC